MPDLATWKFMGPAPFVEPSLRWVRVRWGDTLLADSRRAYLLSWYGPGRLPTYCFPADDVQTELLEPSAETATDTIPYAVKHDIVVGDEKLPAAATRFVDAPSPFDVLDDHWTFAWETGLTWLEEAMEVHVHARDPHKRVDVVPSERHVQIEIDGVTVADTHRAHALFETTLPTRWYIPPEDIRRDLLQRTPTSTQCPYKGTASYYSVRVGDTVHSDIAWTYLEPIPECPRIRGLVAFFNERVDVIIDGERQERPASPWSR
jgi:uncharacterized protein (DUF427 family)